MLTVVGAGPPTSQPCAPASRDDAVAPALAPAAAHALVAAALPEAVVASLRACGGMPACPNTR